MPSLKTTVELQFGGRCKRPPQGVHFAPGRLLLLGEHLPLLDGQVLATPVPEGVACAWGVRPDSRVVVWGMNARQKDSFHGDQLFKSGRVWADLARGAYAHVGRDRGRMPGIDLMVMGDLPQGEGLASSAAYLVVLLRSIYEAVGVYRSKWELAEDVPLIEREWRGVESDTAAPYVVAAAKPGQVLYVDCRHLNHEVLHLDTAHELCAEETGIDRSRSDPRYDARRLELAVAADEVVAAVPDLFRLPDLSVKAFVQIEGRLSEVTRKRARYVVTETHRVSRAYDALQRGDMQKLGQLMYEAHQSLAHDFESSTREVDHLVDLAMSKPSILGARMNGMGWGGRLAVLQST